MATRRQASYVAPVAFLLAVALGLGGLGWWTGRDRDDDRHAAAWDPEVRELVDFVERERGLTFREPVPIKMLDDRAFAASLRDSTGFSDDDRDDLAASASVLAAVGLVEPGFDLETALLDDVSGVLGYYTWEQRRIVVRGTTLDLATRGVLVHELTHALQDQHFDLGRHFETDPEADLARRTLIEGDAVAVERAWVADLSQGDQERYAIEINQLADRSELADLPPALVALSGAPYGLGPALVAGLRDDGGQEGLDAALADPPRTDHSVLDPRNLLMGEEPAPVDSLDGPGADRTDPATSVGALGAYLFLAERLPAARALAAADAWLADGATPFVDDGRACADIQVRHDPSDAALLGEALREWLAAATGSGTAVPVDHEHHLLTTCAPDGPVDSRALESIALPIVRAEVYARAVAELGEVDAWCVATEVTGSLTDDDLPRLSYGSGAVELEAAMQRAALDCGTG